jgi:hypothetical protein
MDSGSSQHSEAHLDNPVQGWPRLALYMSKNPHTAAFSQFADLNVKNLLYYQAELTRLRLDLNEMEHEDFYAGGKKGKDNEHARHFAHHGGDETDETAEDNVLAPHFARRADYLMKLSPNSNQFKLVMEIRGVLKEYSELLVIIQYWNHFS